MTTTNSHEASTRKSLRVWPGVTLAVILLCVRYALALVFGSDAEIFELPLDLVGMLGAVLCGVLIIGWWILFSRAPWRERLGVVVLMVVAMTATRLIVDKSIANAGQGNLLYVLAIPGLGLGLVVGALAASRLSGGARRAALVAAIVLACAPWALLRTSGVGGPDSGFHWRWTPTPEERLLAERGDELKTLPPLSVPSTAPASVPQEPVPAATGKPGAPPAAETPVREEAVPATKPDPVAPAVTEGPAEWPGFRGPERDGIVRGVRINPDWSTAPPVEIWRRPIGPGWSSFSVRGEFLYTQEQRGEDEIVASYKLSTGEPVWAHRDPVRFWESNGGAGPRSTPTLDGNRVFAFGATGILNALDARTGKVLWSRNAPSDTKRATPYWGFASSPLVVGNTVVVAVSGTLTAYDTATGAPRWTGPRHGGSYSSPHLATIDSVDQIVLLSGAGATGVAAATGALLWEHEWEGSVIVQPALTENGDVVVNTIASTGGLGTRRLAVTHASGGWTVKERWTSNGLKPYFNDFVIHKGHAYGFDGAILACINLEDGQRRWKGGRYGNGQLVLLADQDLLLVLSEDGELALVKATTDQYKEIARFPVLNAKTWNHPVLVGDVLLVRNGEEMAAFRLTLAGEQTMMR